MDFKKLKVDLIGALSEGTVAPGSWNLGLGRRLLLDRLLLLPTLPEGVVDVGVVVDEGVRVAPCSSAVRLGALQEGLLRGADGEGGVERRKGQKRKFEGKRK